MRPRGIVQAFGWGIAIAGLMLAIFEAGQATWRRWVEWKARTHRKATSPVPDKRVSLIPPQPQPLPPDYSVFVLCYHDFREKPTKWSITPQQLEKQLQTLKEFGFTFLTVSEAVDLLTGRWHGRIPDRAVVITVDDGFRSAYTVLFPLLKRYGAKATLFIYTGWINKGREALTWEQLREMAESGLVEIASHTVTHTYPRRLRGNLPYEQYRDRMKWEFEQSKQELERKLGVKVSGIAYPGGYVDGTMKALAQQAGYRWGAVVNPKPLTVHFDRYAIPRYGVSSETTVAMLKAWVTKQPVRLIRFRAKDKRLMGASKLNKGSTNRAPTRTPHGFGSRH